MEFLVIKDDITIQNVDAIVNAANSSLLGGGGVDGAIHRAAGPKLLDECLSIRARQGGCKTGEAVITGAGNLLAKYVIHTVGPVWNNGKMKESFLLEKCYQEVMKIAEENKINSIAFPNISTGIYGFPKELAVSIVYDFFKNYKKDYSFIKKVLFVTFDDENFILYNNTFKDI